MNHDDESVIVRVDDGVPTGPSLPGVRLRIAGILHPGDADSRRRAAEALNRCDVVIVQHEYGIYGGRDGEEVVDLLALVRRPVVTVMHTVLTEPSVHQRAVIAAVVDRTDIVVAMTAAGSRLLEDGYGVPSSRLRLIPHGVDRWALPRPSPAPHRSTVLTWGLLGPGKGIEWGIRAIAALKDAGHAPRYRVLGQTHPKVVMESGQQYRRSLWALAEELGVGELVEIDGRYRESDELAADVVDADIVLLPYDSREQTTSGVLVEAVAAGRPVIATRFPHAVELLTAGAGLLVDHESPEQIAAAILSILQGTAGAGAARARETETEAFSGWASVADRYRALSAELSVPMEVAG
ncbi:glycosyltransferase involved in cell wall biosynthesis [Microbacterium resistens]|uniref:Glycosyltransferase involved in cell wall biosynthesis n=1 Tax=Microbacterium resistens TaxID=156977 RepID=A0ABU1SGP2_9MICO|nr:glycosyltransferase [Microbacterium resistens]MDR6868784.1 glycosyltransferase involved in cell wall biosynthesis [Microbacterium resistens]